MSIEIKFNEEIVTTAINKLKLLSSNLETTENNIKKIGELSKSSIKGKSFSVLKLLNREIEISMKFSKFELEDITEQLNNVLKEFVSVDSYIANKISEDRHGNS